MPQSPGRQRDRPWPAPTHLQMPVMLRLVAAASTRDQLVCAMKCGPNTAGSFFQEKLLKRNQKSLFLCEICQFKKCWLKCLKCGKCRECKLCSHWKTVRGFPQKTKIKTTRAPRSPTPGLGPAGGGVTVTTLRPTFAAACSQRLGRGSDPRPSTAEWTGTRAVQT